MRPLRATEEDCGGRRGDGSAPAPALELRGVEKRFGATRVLRGVTLSIATGERHAIIGPNGAGKSTLFDVISGRFPPSRGSIRLHGREIAGTRPFRINRRGLARSFQLTHLFGRLSVQENLRCAAFGALGYRACFWRNGAALPKVEARVAATLDEIGLAARRDVPASMLTYAEQRALEIGIAIVGGASVILLDEPTSGMSRAEADHAVALIRRISEGRSLVIVEHDMSVVFGLADRVSVLVYGEVLATDAPERVRVNAAVRRAYLGDLAGA